MLVAGKVLQALCFSMGRDVLCSMKKRILWCLWWLCGELVFFFCCIDCGLDYIALFSCLKGKKACSSREMIHIYIRFLHAGIWAGGQLDGIRWIWGVYWSIVHLPILSTCFMVCKVFCEVSASSCFFCLNFFTVRKDIRKVLLVRLLVLILFFFGWWLAFGGSPNINYVACLIVITY